jgi:hypothetical protein
MNAETRAKEIAKIINASGDDHDLITAFGQVVIASAIRQAENDKLEEAAAILDEYRSSERSDYAAGQDTVAREAAAEIRSLKSKD